MSDASLEQPIVTEDNQLKRTLGPVSLIMLGIGSIIGAGSIRLLFVLGGINDRDRARLKELMEAIRARRDGRGVSPEPVG